MLLAGNESSLKHHHNTFTATEVVQTQVRSPTIVDESNESRPYPQQFLGLQGNNATSRGSMHGLESHAVKSAGSFESAVQQQQQECSEVKCSAGTSSTAMFPPVPPAGKNL